MSTTLEEARQSLQEALTEGIQCPCCDQLAKVYRRKINATMAQALITMYRHANRRFVHVPSLPGDTHEVSQLVWWGLIEQDDNPRRDGGRAGVWRLTSDGVKFVLGQIDVPKYALVYDGECRGLDESEWLNIHAALGTKFRYDDLMSGN